MTPLETPPVEPLSRMRRAIAAAMSQSALIPQFTLESDASFQDLSELRATLAEQGGHLSYSDVLIAAVARALVGHPRLNASFSDEGIVYRGSINIGSAVALDDGLVAPAILAANELSLAEIASERTRLAAAAQAGKLSPEDLLSATFTISNLGTFGIRRFRPLVVPPQTAILGVGALTPESLVSLSLSCDHRTVDGAPAAAFLRDLVGLLESPGWIEGIS